MDTNLLEISQSNEDSVRTASEHRQSYVKVRLIYMISSKRKAKILKDKSNTLNCKIGYRPQKILVQNSLPASMKGKLAKLN